MESNCPLCGHVLEALTGIVFDKEANFILFDGKFIKTTLTERRILILLIENSPHVVSIPLMMDSIYGLLTDKEEPSNSILGVFICRIRATIKDSNYEILTVRGKGWLFRKKVLENGKEESRHPPITNQRPCVYDTPPG